MREDMNICFIQYQDCRREKRRGEEKKEEPPPSFLSLPLPPEGDAPHVPSNKFGEGNALVHVPCLFLFLPFSFSDMAEGDEGEEGKRG